MKRIAALIATFIVLVCTASAGATVTFNGDFETGDGSQWPLQQMCSTALFNVFSTPPNSNWPPPIEGNYAARLYTRTSDYWTGPGANDCSTGPGSRRTQIASGTVIPTAQGSSVWEGFWVYAGPGYTAATGETDKWLVFQEDFGAPFNGSPPFSFDIGNVNGVSSFKLDQNPWCSCPVDTRWSTPITQGWHHFVVHKRMSTVNTGSNTSGYVELTYDGVAQTFTSGTRSADNKRVYGATVSPDATGDYRFYLTNYYGPAITSNVWMFFDGARVGTTQADVDLPANTGGGGGSAYTFEDDFTGAAGVAPDSSKWVDWCPSTGTAYALFGSIRCGADETLDGAGHLRVPATPTWGSALTTKTKFSQKLGTFSAWIKLPPQSGYWPAFWMLNGSQTGTEAHTAEFDVMEAWTQYANTNAWLHLWDGTRDTDATGSICYTPTTDAFHKYSVKWTTTSLTFSVDDVTCVQMLRGSYGAAVWDDWMSRPAWMILDLAVGGQSQSPPTVNATMLVDRVEVTAT